MAWAAAILLAVAQGCWAQFRYQNGAPAQTYPIGMGQYGSLYGLRSPWFGLGTGCGPCSLRPPPPCQCLQPQASSGPEEKTGLNAMDMEPPPPPTTTTTTTTTTPPPPPVIRQPSMSEYIPPPPQPPCPSPVQGCICIPGLLSMACLPACMMQGLFRVQTAGQYGQPVSQFSSEPVSQFSSQPVSQYGSQPVSQYGSQPVSQFSSQPVSQFSSQPVSQFSSQPVSQFSSEPVSQFSSQPVSQYGSQPVSQYGSQPVSQYGSQPFSQFSSQPVSQYTSGQAGPDTGYVPLSSPFSSQISNQPLGLNSSPNLNQATLYSQNLNQQYPSGYGNVNQPSLYPSQILNQQYPSSYGPSVNQPLYPQTLTQSGLYGGQTGNHPLYSNSLNQPYGYPTGQNPNQPSLFSSKSLTQRSTDSQNLPSYGSQKLNQPTHPGSSLGLSNGEPLGTKRSLGQDFPKPSSKKTDK